jgi:hypothetical protein
MGWILVDQVKVEMVLTEMHCSCWSWLHYYKTKQTKQTPVAWVRERTILTKRPPLVSEVDVYKSLVNS